MSEGTNISRERIIALSHEHVDVIPYDPEWPKRYQEEEDLLLRSLPMDLVQRIVHIGSTAVPGLSAKPIIDVQVEVSSLERVRREVVPIMEDLGHEYIWRPTMGERAPFYAWFIRRNAKGDRTHHGDPRPPVTGNTAPTLGKMQEDRDPDRREQTLLDRRVFRTHHLGGHIAHDMGDPLPLHLRMLHGEHIVHVLSRVAETDQLFRLLPERFGVHRTKVARRVDASRPSVRPTDRS